MTPPKHPSESTTELPPPTDPLWAPWQTLLLIGLVVLTGLLIFVVVILARQNPWIG